MKQKHIFHAIIATGFGSGFFPFAPGTVGALLATAVWLLFAFLLPAHLFITTLLLILIFAVLGILATDALEHVWGKDPSKVVVDEMVGMWIALLPLNAGNLYYVLAAFILFRLFDIFKPFGIRKLESIKGGLGVMMDDVLAGIYSLIIVIGLKWVIG